MVLLRFDLLTLFLTRHDLFFILAFIQINILTKFHEDWIKTVPCRVYSLFYSDLTK